MNICLFRRLAFCLSLCALGINLARGHGDLHERIDALSAQIATARPDAGLILKRAELYREHQEWDAALTDCNRAAELDPSLDAVFFLRARTLLAAGRTAEALAAADRFLHDHPEHAEGLLTRARCLEKLGRHAEAAAAFEVAIVRNKEPQPEYFLEKAAALRASGSDPLPSLDEGIAKLGPIISLETPAIEIEMARKDYQPALRRVEQLAARSERKEAWLARKADILAKAGRLSDARTARAEAMQAIDSLPDRLRKTPAMQDLAVHLRSELERATVNP